MKKIVATLVIAISFAACKKRDFNSTDSVTLAPMSDEFMSALVKVVQTESSTLARVEKSIDVVSNLGGQQMRHLAKAMSTNAEVRNALLSYLPAAERAAFSTGLSRLSDRAAADLEVLKARKVITPAQYAEAIQANKARAGELKALLEGMRKAGFTDDKLKTLPSQVVIADELISSASQIARSALLDPAKAANVRSYGERLINHSLVYAMAATKEMNMPENSIAAVLGRNLDDRVSDAFLGTTSSDASTAFWLASARKNNVQQQMEKYVEGAKILKNQDEKFGDDIGCALLASAKRLDEIAKARDVLAALQPFTLFKKGLNNAGTAAKAMNNNLTGVQNAIRNAIPH